MGKWTALSRGFFRFRQTKKRLAVHFAANLSIAVRLLLTALDIWILAQTFQISNSKFKIIVG